MKIGIISFASPSKRAKVEELRLQNVARSMGHSVRIFRAANFKMVYDRHSPWLLYDNKVFPKLDFVLIRPSILKNVSLHMSLIEQMELMGVVLFNRFGAILASKNKIKTTQILDHHNIPIPQTVIIRRSEDLASAAKRVGGFPLIVKQPTGSFGNGVVIVESMRALKSFLLWDQPMYLIQEYVKYSKGKDIRIFVVNGKVIGSMMRSAKKGEFRSNIELGGIGRPVEITEEEAGIALRSVQALDLDYGGVDVMRSENGPVVLEVNSNPGFKSLEDATGIDVARALIEYGVEYATRRKV